MEGAVEKLKFTVREILTHTLLYESESARILSKKIERARFSSDFVGALRTRAYYRIFIYEVVELQILHLHTLTYIKKDI